jgi:hypothetical protein
MSIGQGCTNRWRQGAVATTFCTVERMFIGPRYETCLTTAFSKRARVRVFVCVCVCV